MTLGSGLGRWTVPLLRLSFLPSAGPVPAADPGIQHQHHQQHQNGRWSGLLTGPAPPPPAPPQHPEEAWRRDPH
ncbi:hypothetical protein DPEC_G00247010 [Dallia pectoralis]|uniref:Uncharacterized protein n=1 Tax=Dallia pectoralis TaxID=75939 RepID=A0ACC2FWM4_DALPE|nr:hypothetical protein DPEC_G00247010 [Dallia pectoralis]